MEIIPVIDLLQGRVVQASGGVRAAYQPLESPLTKQTDVIGVIADLLRFHAFQTFYIADLDALEGVAFNLALYRKLVTRFPQLTIWLDAGIRTRADWQALASTGVQPIIGSETLQDKSLLEEEDIRCRSILSLDHRGGELLGRKNLPASCYWPEKVIVMGLDAIGAAQGPDLTLLASLHIEADRQWFMAGGVRDMDDIVMLKEREVAGVLIASALHSGAIKQHQL